jgi:hypothetical protein
MRRRFKVGSEPNKQFVWDDITIHADLYFPHPLHCIVQFDDATHCTRERAKTFANYPADAPLNFDVRRYLADQAPGDAALAHSDMLTDLLPPKRGFNPTVRIRFDEINELTGPLTERIESLLSTRFALHAGTNLDLMIDNAGAKPHRTQGR